MLIIISLLESFLPSTQKYPDRSNPDRALIGALSKEIPFRRLHLCICVECGLIGIRTKNLFQP